MKHLKKFENYTKEDIKRVLTDAIKKGDVNVENVLKELDKTVEPDWKTDPFGHMVYTNASFISEADKKRMPEYIEKLKKMTDTIKLEELLPKFMEYRQLYMKDEENIRFTRYDSEKEEDKAYRKLYDKMDKLEPFVKEFETELRDKLKSLK